MLPIIAPTLECCAYFGDKREGGNTGREGGFACLILCSQKSVLDISFPNCAIYFTGMFRDKNNDT